MNRVRSHTGPLWPYLVLIAVPLLRLRAAGPDQRSPGHHGRQPAAELPPARPGGRHAAPRPAPVLEPVHLQRDSADGRLQRGRLLSAHGPLRRPARPGGLDRHRGDPLLGHRHQHVRLPTGAEALDDGLPGRRRDLRLRRSGAQPGQPRRHDRGIPGHPLDAPGRPPHRARRALAVVDPARGCLRQRDPGRSTGGHARRGAARRWLSP